MLLVYFFSVEFFIKMRLNRNCKEITFVVCFFHLTEAKTLGRKNDVDSCCFQRIFIWDQICLLAFSQTEAIKRIKKEADVYIGIAWKFHECPGKKKSNNSSENESLCLPWSNPGQTIHITKFDLSWKFSWYFLFLLWTWNAGHSIN